MSRIIMPHIMIYLNDSLLSWPRTDRGTLISQWWRTWENMAATVLDIHDIAGFAIGPIGCLMLDVLYGFNYIVL